MNRGFTDMPVPSWHPYSGQVRGFGQHVGVSNEWLCRAQQPSTSTCPPHPCHRAAYITRNSFLCSYVAFHCSAVALIAGAGPGGGRWRGFSAAHGFLPAVALRARLQ